MTARSDVYEIAVGRCIEARVGESFSPVSVWIDLDTCDHLDHLLDFLKKTDGIVRFFRDPLWAERVTQPEGRAMVLGELAKYGTALARLTVLVEDPPEVHRLNASIHREIITRDQNVVAFPTPRPEADS